MAVNMKKCKECGKLFTPKGRESYCSEKHFRPCPICGEPAEVLYFADPPRRCDKCRGKKSLKPATPVKQLVKPDTKVEEVVKEQQAVPAIDKDIQKIVDENFPAVDMDKDELLNENHVWTYVGKSIRNSFIPGHVYSIRVSNDGAAYTVVSDEDMTSGQIVNINDRFSSVIMLNQNFVKSSPSA